MIGKTSSIAFTREYVHLLFGGDFHRRNIVAVFDRQRVLAKVLLGPDAFLLSRVNIMWLEPVNISASPAADRHFQWTVILTCILRG
jgi:hypothetical protein